MSTQPKFSLATGYKACSRCLMDTQNMSIAFDEQGICNYCYQYAVEIAQDQANGTFTNDKLVAVIEEIGKRDAEKALTVSSV